MRNATPSLLELNVAFSWLVEKQAIYHSRPPLDSFAFGNKFVSFTDKLVFRARDFVRVAPFVGKKFPACAAAASVSHGVRFQPAKVWR